MLCFANLITAFLVAIIFQHVIVAAAPISDVDAHELIVFNPPITAPKESAAWAKGSVQTVRWGKYQFRSLYTNRLYLILSTLTLSILETSGMPHQRMSNTGVLLLGYMENDSENLDIGMEAAHLVFNRISKCSSRKRRPSSRLRVLNTHRLS